MPFDRAGAKAAGYTDAEIDAYLSQSQQPGSAEARVGSPAATFRKGAPITPYIGASDVIEANPLLNPIDFIPDLLTGGAAIASTPGALRLAGRGLGSVARGGARMVGDVAGAPIIRRLPGAAMARNISKDALGMLGRAGQGAEEAVGSALSRIRGGVGRASMEAPLASGARAAEEAAAEAGAQRATGKVVGEIRPKVKPRRAPKAKAAKGSAESRTMPPAEQAGARDVGRAQAGGKSQAMRGASKPALERRAAARAAPDAGEVDDLTQMLEQSIEVEQKMAKGALSPSERAFVRRGVREGGRPGPVVKGSAQSRVAASAAGPSRHEVQYFSESQGKFIPIETMHIAQLKNAMNKLGRKLAESNRPSPVTKKQFEALRDEVTHRLQQAGELTVY